MRIAASRRHRTLCIRFLQLGLLLAFACSETSPPGADADAGLDASAAGGTSAGGAGGSAAGASGTSGTSNTGGGAGEAADAGRDAAAADADAGPSCQGATTLRCAEPTRFVGTAVNLNAYRSDAPYRVVLPREFSSATPENDGKWAPLQPTRTAWRFENLDAIFDTAQASGQVLHGHTFVWHYDVPAWASALPAAELSAALREHIEKTVERYKGRVRAWDVVNEALDDGTLRLRAGIHQTLGIDGLATAFKWAHAKDPNALLFYNDYAIEDVNPKSQAVLALVQQLKAAGAPVHGVGFQAHVSTQTSPSEAGLRANMRRFAAAGLKVRVSELDVRTVAVPGSRSARLAQQSIVYRVFGAVCATEPNCEGVTTWGFTDKHSWVDTAFAPDDPLPFDESYEPKPAYRGFLEGLRGAAPLAGVNLVQNGDCSSVTGWQAFGPTTIASVPGGRRGAACRATGRTLDWHGLAQSLLGKVANGDTISLTAWARVSAASAPVHATLKITTTGSPDVYQGVAAATANNSGWTLLTGNAALGWSSAPTTLQLYFQGPGAGVDVLVDDVSLQVLTR